MKTDVSSTSIDYYHSPEGKKALGAQELLVLGVLKHAGARGLTLSEIRQQIIREGGPALPESTISGRCHDLEEKGAATSDNPKRECSITGRSKIIWTYMKPDANPQRSLFSRN